MTQLNASVFMSFNSFGPKKLITVATGTQSETEILTKRFPSIRLSRLEKVSHASALCVKSVWLL